LEFKPSEIAAAVAMNVMGEAQTVDTGEAISVLIQHVEKVRMVVQTNIIYTNDGFYFVILGSFLVYHLFCNQ